MTLKKMKSTIILWALLYLYLNNCVDSAMETSDLLLSLTMRSLRALYRVKRAAIRNPTLIIITTNIGMVNAHIAPDLGFSVDIQQL